MSARFGHFRGTARTRGSLLLAPQPVGSPVGSRGTGVRSGVAAAVAQPVRQRWPGATDVPARAAHFGNLPHGVLGRRGLVAALAAVVAIAAHLVDPSWVAAGPILCPVRRVTGIPCPGCGMTRAAVALAHGDMASAMAFHPLSPLVAVAAVGALVAYVRTGSLPRVPSGIAAAGVALVMGVWVVRLATGFGPV